MKTRKMTKRETIRNMYERAMNGESSTTYAISYVMRRLGLDEHRTKEILAWMDRNEGCVSCIVGRNVVFMV